MTMCVFVCACVHACMCVYTFSSYKIFASIRGYSHKASKLPNYIMGNLVNYYQATKDDS